MNIESSRQKLEEEKMKLETEMGSIGQKNPRVENDWEAAPEEPGIESNLADQADIIVARENTAAIFSDLEARYDTVLAALSKIGKGTYGTCDVCGADIAEARLTADPAAATCIAHL